jgi:DNA mismatch repair protein MutS
MDESSADGAGAPVTRTSPLRTQYDALKREHVGRILLFQLGDFYEAFEGDAQIVSRVCDVTLTSKELSKGDRVRLAGVPVSRAAPHIGKLIGAGYHVAICDQVSEPGKGLVEREVTRIITPGTVAEPGLIVPGENNLLVALYEGRNGIGLAAGDVTTGELTTTTMVGPEDQALLAAELQRLAPAECLVAAGTELDESLPGHLTILAGSAFDAAAADDRLRRLFGVSSLDGFGLPLDSPALSALGALVEYVGANNHRLLASLREPRAYAVGSHVALDPTTRRNLELVRTVRHGQVRGSLRHAVDRTRTPMGARRLRRLLGQPMRDVAAIDARLDAVEALVHDSPKRGHVRLVLGRLGDLERLLGRIRQEAATAREVLMLANALRAVPALRAEFEAATGLLRTHERVLDACPALAETIEQALAEPGGPRTIRPGHSRELDDLVAGMAEARRWLAHLETKERERTGIRSLKVGYNRVFGYYLEVTRPNLKAVPADYQRRQSLVSSERFVTPELKEREALILTAEARVEELERELFLALLRRIAEQARPLLAMVEAVADLDVLAALADVAAERGWTRPAFTTDGPIRIVGARHPVLEALMPGGDVVPNDCTVGAPDARLLIVTGPNMGGKSTYLRMLALMVLLAQTGSFVPATAATITPVDRLFTRVGSEDDLVAGASTFLVEMSETANILRHATPRSLVVLDEVGRGTSTHDGLCIAQAVLEHLHDEVGAMTLFATHFHELTALADDFAGVRNVTVAVDERDGQLAFLYRVIPGAADRSYGVQVAKLAGLPASVTARAETLLLAREAGMVLPLSDSPLADPGPIVLGELDGGPPPQAQRRIAEPGPAYDVSGNHDGPHAPAPVERERERGEQALTPALSQGEREQPAQPNQVAASVLAELLSLDLGSLTPIRALNLLHDLQSAARATLPWRSWLGDLTRTRSLRPRDSREPSELERG